MPSPELATDSDAPVAGEPSDVDLVRAHLRGDARAFERLIERHHRSVYALTLRLTGDRMTAEDLTQETFLQVLRTIRRLDDDTFKISAWIHRIASNLCYDVLRERQRLPLAEARPADEAQPDPAELLPDTTASSDPQRSLESKELKRRIWEVSQRLPENYRLVLHLRELQGMSYQQIARAMGVSDSAVETLLYRARIRFKEEFLSLEAGGQLRPCATVKPLLRQYLAMRLRAAQRRMVKDHIAQCGDCRAELEQMRTARTAR
jgi:RNA polymerase sigma-70 factor (ECF subfamily)